MTQRRDRERRRHARLPAKLAVFGATLVALLGLVEWAARARLRWKLRSLGAVYEAAEVAGYRLSPNASREAFGTWVQTNSLGYRGTEWSEVKPQGVFRIALIGDSNAFGFGVAFSQTMGEVLERAAETRTSLRCEVLNFALPGYNSVQQRAILRDLALDFGPDLVLVVVSTNDHHPALRVDEAGLLHWPGDGTLVTGSNVQTAATWLPLRHSVFLAYVCARWRRGKTPEFRLDQHLGDPQVPWMGEIPPGPIPHQLAREVLMPLYRMAQLCQKHSVPLAVASLAPSPEYRRTLRRLEQETGVPVFELMTLLPEVTSGEELVERFSLGWDAHPNPEAHERFGEGLARWLAESDLVPTK